MHGAVLSSTWAARLPAEHIAREDKWARHVHAKVAILRHMLVSLEIIEGYGKLQIYLESHFE